MAVTTLNTHEVVKDLLAAGFTGDQAEAVTRVVRRAQDIDSSDLATKADLQTALAYTKSEILKWFIGSVGAQTVVTIGTVVALVKTIVH